MAENEAVAKLKDLIKRDGIFKEHTVVVFTSTLRDVVAYVEELEAKVPAEPERVFKLGDKVQEITDAAEKPWGYVIEERELGQFVKLENTNHAGRKLLYYDDEIVPFGDAPESKFKVGQKVATLETIQVNRSVIKAGTVGTVIAVDAVRMHEFEVAFTGAQGTFSFGFDADELKAVEA